MNINEIDTIKKPIILIDESLDFYSGKVLFPEKLAKANKMLKEVGLPDFTKLELERKQKEAQQNTAEESTPTD